MNILPKTKIAPLPLSQKRILNELERRIVRS